MVFLHSHCEKKCGTKWLWNVVTGHSSLIITCLRVSYLFCSHNKPFDCLSCLWWFKAQIFQSVNDNPPSWIGPLNKFSALYQVSARKQCILCCALPYITIEIRSVSELSRTALLGCRALQPHVFARLLLGN